MTHQVRPINNNLTIFSEAEYAALYNIPEFDDSQRIEYFTLTNTELQVLMKRKLLAYKVSCILQLGYFKAVNIFFPFKWDEVNFDDVSFILQRYFPNQHMEIRSLTKHEYYTQCFEITSFFHYKTWSKKFEELLFLDYQKLCRDIKPQSIAIEILAFLKHHQIIRPAYTTFQLLVSSIIQKEQQRVNLVITTNLNQSEIKTIKHFLVEENTFSQLAAIKQDAKNFKPKIIAGERDKLAILYPVYQMTKRLSPELKLSQQNMQYYAELIHFYSIYELRSKKNVEQAYLYILCYCWWRYRQISDNLANAFCFYFRQIESKIKEISNNALSQHIKDQHEEASNMLKLASLYVDDSLSDELSFGEVRNKAFSIIPKDELITRVKKNNRKIYDSDFYWQAIDGFKRGIKSHLRSLVEVLDFSSVKPYAKWLEALTWITTKFHQSQKQAPLILDHPEGTIPIKLLPYFSISIAEQVILLNQTRYEFWVYRQLNRYLKSGGIFLEDSLQYRSLRPYAPELTLWASLS
jgi:hypothetical protein